MAKPARKIDDEQLVKAWKAGKSAVEIAKGFAVPVMSVYNRMRRLRRAGVALPRRASLVDTDKLNRILAA